MAKAPLPHHLVALWFADISGYSGRAAQDERGALQLIEILQTLSRTIVQRYDGRVVKFLGDAVLAEFGSTEMAVRAAATLGQQFRKESASTVAHTTRVGVHIGDVAVDADGDSTVMASMRRRGSRQLLILARWSSAKTSGVKSVGGKGSVSNHWVIGILEA